VYTSRWDLDRGDASRATIRARMASVRLQVTVESGHRRGCIAPTAKGTRGRNGLCVSCHRAIPTEFDTIPWKPSQIGDISRLEGDWPLQALAPDQAGHGYPAPVVASQLLCRPVGVGQRSGQPDRPEWSQGTACWASTANWRISSSKAFSAVSGALHRRHLFILPSSLPLHPRSLTPTLSMIRYRRSHCTGPEVTSWGHEKHPFRSTDTAVSNQDP
jgi:hypothetical protein